MFKFLGFQDFSIPIQCHRVEIPEGVLDINWLDRHIYSRI